jgi:hypothetical protein
MNDTELGDFWNSSKGRALLAVRGNVPALRRTVADYRHEVAQTPHAHSYLPLQVAESLLQEAESEAAARQAAKAAEHEALVERLRLALEARLQPSGEVDEAGDVNTTPAPDQEPAVRPWWRRLGR